MLVKLILSVTILILFVTSLKTQTVTDSIMNQGVNRTYHYHVPTTYNGIEELPLVVILHGGNSTGQSFMSNSYFDEIGDTASFFAVFPDAYLGNWTDGRGNTAADSAGIDDIFFLSAMIDSIASDYAIDTCRLYITGISNGGMMTHRFACEYSEKFQGYASIAASISTNYYPNCSPSSAVNMMMIHGTEDNFSPYAGGPSSVPSSTGTVTGIDSTITFWANHNSCTNVNTPDSIVFPDLNTSDNGYVVSYDYAPCTPNGDVMLYKVYGGGHTLPGGPGPVFFPIVGYSNKDVNGAYEIWKFFSDKSCSTVTSIDETTNQPSVFVYPNPTADRVVLKTEEIFKKATIYNLFGAKVITSNGSDIDVSILASGTYIIRIEFENHQSPQNIIFEKM